MTASAKQNLVARAADIARQAGTKMKEDTKDIPVAKVAQKLPGVQVFGDDTIVFQLYRGRDKKVRGSTLRIWRDEDGSPVLLDAALNPISVDFSYVSWQGKGYTGSAIVEAGETQFVVELALDLDSPTDPIGDEGEPDTSWLKKRPVRAIAFNALEAGVEYTVEEILDDGQYALISRDDEKAERYYLSSRLGKLVEQEGGELPFAFLIDGYEPVEIDGETVQAPIVVKAGAADFADVLG